MNPFCEIEVIKTDLVGQIFSQASQNNRTISAVVHGFDGSWPDSIKLNNEVRQAGDSAFYSVSSSGLYGFAFADLGPSFSYQYTVKASSETAAETTTTTVPTPLTKTITDSETLEAFLSHFMDEGHKLTWRLRGRQPGKLLMAAIMA